MLCFKLINRVGAEVQTSDLFVQYDLVHQLRRKYSLDQCRPKHLAWQWAVKESPDIHRCSKLCLKKKQCPKKRFFPRFKKTYVPMDITSCTEEEASNKKPMTWKEYFSFLLPEEYTHKPPLTMCRRLMEMRWRKCLDEKEWMKCAEAQVCGPPVEWFDKTVVMVPRQTLPAANKEPLPKHCPPPDHVMPRCAIAKLAICPTGPKVHPCLEESKYKVPFSDFKGGVTPNENVYNVKCPMKTYSSVVPITNDKSLKLKCFKHYGELKGVECPKQMFNRFMSVDLPGGSLRPVPAGGYEQQREIIKGICHRTTLTKPRSIRNYHVSAIVFSEKNDGYLPEYAQHTDTSSYLQPSKSAVSMNKLTMRAGFNIRELPDPYEAYELKELQKAKREEMKKIEDEEDNEEYDKILPAKEEPKSPLQRLIEKQNQDVKVESDIKPNEPIGILRNPVEVEDAPYQIRKIHTAVRLHKKDNHNKDKNSGQSNNKNNNDEDGDEDLGPICGGCVGIDTALKKTKSLKASIINCRMRGSGKCPGPARALRPGEEPPTNPYQAGKGIRYGRCIQPRTVVCKQENVYDMDCMKVHNTKNKKKYHTSTPLKGIILAQEDGKTASTTDGIEEDEYCPTPKLKKHPKPDLSKAKIEPKLEECPKPKGHIKKKCTEEKKVCVSQVKKRGLICRIAGAFGVGCGRK